MQNRRRGDSSRLDRRCQAQDFIPVFADDAQIQCVSDHGIERFVSAACADDIEPPVGEIANARRVAESQEMAEAEYVIDRAGGVGVVLADVD